MNSPSFRPASEERPPVPDRHQDPEIGRLQNSKYISQQTREELQELRENISDIESSEDRTRAEALVQALNRARQLPFVFQYKNIAEEVNFSQGELIVGKQRYYLEGRASVGRVNIKDMSIEGDALRVTASKLWFSVHKTLPKSLILGSISRILNMTPQESIQITHPNDPSITLLITRTV